MIGKSFKVNDYKFTYGQGAVFVNMYGAFKYLKNGNKYAIYSYENQNKLFYGAFFKKKNEVVIMSSKEDPKDIISEFIDMIIKKQTSDKFEIISLEDVESVQIIEEYVMDSNVNMDKLYDLTMPKPVVEEKPVNYKKPMSIAVFFFVIFIAVVIAFFVANPEVIMGKNRKYSCVKSYYHDTLPATVNEDLLLVFDSKGKIISFDTTSDYVFYDMNYYNEFKEKSYFYQYMEEGDTYKFIDKNYTYRLFSEKDVVNNFFLPTEESELISHYKDNRYSCKVVEVDE